MAVVGELIVLITGNHIPLLGSIASSEAAMVSWGARAGAIMVGIGAAAAVIGVKAIESGSKFSDSMTLIETQAGASREEVESMTTAILKLAPTVATGPQELSEALFHIESTAHQGADALDILTTAAKLAKIGQADLETTTNALLAVTNSGIGGFNGMTEAAGILNAIIGAGNMRMDELVGAIGTGFLATAATVGVSMQSIGASLATMTYAGQDPIDSANRLRMAMASFASPTGAMTKNLAKIGLGSLDLATEMRGPNGVLGAIQMLHEHLQGLDPTHQAALLGAAFGKKASIGILTLLQLIEKFPLVQQSIIDNSANLEAAWARISAEASFGWDQIGVSIDVVVKALGLALLPGLESVLRVVDPLAIAFANWATDNPTLAANIWLVAAAVGALAAGALLLGPLIGIIMGLASPLGLAFLGVAAAIALVVTHIDEIAAGIKIVSDAVNQFMAEHGGAPLPAVGLPGDTRSEAAAIGRTLPPPPRAINNPMDMAAQMADDIRLLGGVGSAGIGGLGDLLFRGGKPPETHVTHTTVLNIDGVQLTQLTERYLYQNAGVTSSGFSSDDGIRHQ